ncbi:low specificity L-threonine aldolase [Hoeflea sp. WL0058]|uniref:L-threonine aldolase n=1 Tax=Flavimaribacter sediminis TaxID=2865987 RepID=A0AAE3D122_9HYPH|nr:low specificity L-threonine aldolase [Flavimaribacter sediminis]MBW8639155.1 low specificity L-threonine aldolase [Flavimaribacter sediminis]
MYFASDNWTGAHPRVAASLTKHADGFATAYGASDLDRAIEARFDELFEREVAVFFVGTGTAANALAMAAINRPGGVSFCHREAHVIEDECGAPEFFTHGARLAPVDGLDGKIDPDELQQEIRRFPPDFVHAGQPMAVTITQSTEIGTVYALEEIETISGVCVQHGLPLHMDGSRFANALACLDVSPAELTWKRGVDILSFGGTKNGCWCAEALVFFDPEKAKDLPFIRKRAAQLFSKTRFISAQFQAYFEDGLWLELARHSNAMASRLAASIETSEDLALAWKPQANEVFAILRKSKAQELREKGAVFADWNMPRRHSRGLDDDETLIRLVTSFATTDEHIDRFAQAIGAV